MRLEWFWVVALSVGGCGADTDEGSDDAGVPPTGAAWSCDPTSLAPPGSLCTLAALVEPTLVGRLPGPTTDPRVIVANGTLHVFPGRVAGEPTDETWLAPLGDDGSVGTFVQGEPLPTRFIAAAVPTRIGNRIYLTGGRTAEDSTSERSPRVFSGALRPDGMIESWREEPPLTQGRAHHATLACDGSFAVVGGEVAAEAVATRSFETTGLSAGRLGAWTRRTGETSDLFPAGLAVIGEDVYATGTRNWLFRGRTRDLEGWEQLEDAVAPGGSRLALLGAHGQTLVAVNVTTLVLSTVADDGTLSTWEAWGQFPEELYTYGPGVALTTEHLYVVGNGLDFMGSDEVWAASICEGRP